MKLNTLVIISQKNSFHCEILFIHRHFLLSNGSLLIVNSRLADSGKYRCNATNQFAKKLFRNSFSTLSVMPRTNNVDNHGSSLLSTLQSSVQKIRSGRNLILHCASYTNKVRNADNLKSKFTFRAFHKT